METTIDWMKYGFKENGIACYGRKDFPFELMEADGFISVFNPWELRVPISSGRIPATNQAVVLLLKAFNCPKLP